MSDMKVELKESLARRQAADKLSARGEGPGRPGRSCCRSGVPLPKPPMNWRRLRQLAL